MGRLKFIDSLQFIPQSLDSLVKTLEVDELKYLREEFPFQHEFELFEHYYTAPRLAWDAALKMSRVSLELITDIDMYHFIEKSI